MFLEHFRQPYLWCEPGWFHYDSEQFRGSSTSGKEVSFGLVGYVFLYRSSQGWCKCALHERPRVKQLDLLLFQLNVVSAAAGHHQEQVLFAGAGRAVTAHAQHDTFEDDPRVIQVRIHR